MGLGGYTVDVHDLTASSRDHNSRRLIAPTSWARRSLQQPSSGAAPIVHWGANAVEIETMRYRPRRELNKVLQRYDIIQVVAGTPALAATVTGLGRPVVLQVATLVAWERERLLAEQTGPLRIWRSWMTRMTSRVERRVIRRVDALVVLNSAMFEHARSSGCKRVVKAYPGLAIDGFGPPAAGWRRADYLLSVCRLNEPRKGIERIIRAYTQMTKLDESVPRLVLAGKGQLPETMIDLINRLGLSSRIMIRSDVDAADLPELYRGASVFIQASYEEGLGLSVLEAMASGLPVIATETAGTKETVIPAVTGWLVSQDSPMDVPRLIAAQALHVLRRDGIAFSVGARNRYVRTFSNQIAQQRITGVYDDLLAL
jgi:glycosyltransferase involved in cell wall biosynthesis